jgi:serine/threonine protein phosphatase 1
MREFIIGDIHGGFRALSQLLTNSNFDYDNDRLISLGDLTEEYNLNIRVIKY